MSSLQVEMRDVRNGKNISVFDKKLRTVFKKFPGQRLMVESRGAGIRLLITNDKDYEAKGWKVFASFGLANDDLTGVTNFMYELAAYFKRMA